MFTLSPQAPTKVHRCLLNNIPKRGVPIRRRIQFILYNARILARRVASQRGNRPLSHFGPTTSQQPYQPVPTTQIAERPIR
jgi:hypothetical protein